MTKKHAVSVFVLIFVMVWASSAYGGDASEINKTIVFRRVAGELIQAANTQYTRCMYTHADASLSRAMEYEQYLTVEQLQQVDRLFLKIRVALAQRNVVLEQVNRAAKLIEQGDLRQAEVCLRHFSDNEFLTNKERKQIADKLAELDAESQEPAAVTAAAVGVTDEAVDIKLASLVIPESEPSDESEQFADNVGASPADKAAETKKITKKQKMLRSYGLAVVRDAVAKAKELASEGKFYKGKEALHRAGQCLIKYKADIGSELFDRYNSQLQALEEQIAAGRARWLGNWENRGAWQL